MEQTEWYRLVLNPLLSAHAEPSRAVYDEQVIVLAADTDRTQSYVFESDKLPEIRGASLRLSTLNEGVPGNPDSAVIFQLLAELDVPSRCVLYTSGGSVLALLPPHVDIEWICNRLQAAYPAETGIATISVVWRTFRVEQLVKGLAPAPANVIGIPALDNHQQRVSAYFGQGRSEAPLSEESAASRKHFGEVVSLMSNELRRAKQARWVGPFFEKSPFARTCVSCEIRPATSHAHNDPDQPICTICADKLAQGQERSYWLEVLRGDLEAAGYPGVYAQPPQDLQQINNGGPVAFVYADGDGIGERLRYLSSPAEYTEFSHNLSAITRHAVVESLTGMALDGHAPYGYRASDQDKTRFVHRWDVITIGGDDVLVIIPAQAALRFALQLAATFADGQDLLRMSVGFAIGRAKTPVRLLRDIAYQTLKNAKKRAHKDRAACVDYHNLIKEGMLARTGRGQSSHLTGRPYTLEELGWLDTSISLLQESHFPKSQLYQLVSEIRQGPIRASLFYYYQRARLQARRQPAQFDSLLALEQTWAVYSQEGIWPWLRRPVGDEIQEFSSLPDIVDCYDTFTA